MIALGVLFRQVHVLIHIESDHIAEGHFAGFVEFDQGFVHAQR